MTTEPTPAPPNLFLVKALAAFLGLLLLGGLALLVVLLFTRGPSAPEGGLAPLVLGEGEAITQAAIGEGAAMFVLLRPSGEGRVVVLDLGTGERAELAVRKEGAVTSP